MAQRDEAQVCAFRVFRKHYSNPSPLSNRSAEEQDPRLSFKTFAERAGILPHSTESAS